MEGNLIPGLVNMAEECLGKLGRPLTTLMVLMAVLDVSAWGAHMVWSKIVSPILDVSGVSTDSEVLAAVGLFTTLTLITLAVVLVFTYISEGIRSRGLGTKLE